MTPELIRAAMVLAETLAQENKALAAAALLDAKRTAAGQFVAAHARAVAAGPSDQEPPRDVARIAARLRELAEENKLLLERAILAQRRVIGCIAKAAPKAMQRAPRYDQHGALTDQRNPPPVALSARA